MIRMLGGVLLATAAARPTSFRGSISKRPVGLHRGSCRPIPNSLSELRPGRDRGAQSARAAMGQLQCRAAGGMCARVEHPRDPELVDVLTCLQMAGGMPASFPRPLPQP